MHISNDNLHVHKYSMEYGNGRETIAPHLPTAKPAWSMVTGRSHSPLNLRPPDPHGAWSRVGVTRPSSSDRQTRTEHGRESESLAPHPPTARPARSMVASRNHSPLTLRPPDPHGAWSRVGVTRPSPSDRQTRTEHGCETESLAPHPPTARPARSMDARRSHSPLTLRPPDPHGAWMRDGVTRPSPFDRQTRTEHGRESESLAPHPPTARPARSMVASRSHSPLTLRPPDPHGAWSRDRVTRPPRMEYGQEIHIHKVEQGTPII